MDAERIAHTALHGWHTRVEGAGSVDEVVDTVQDFVASLTPSDVIYLPSDCRPGRIHDESDIDYWNLTLAEACRAQWGTNRDCELLVEVAQIFLRASVRVSRLTEAATHP